MCRAESLGAVLEYALGGSESCAGEGLGLVEIGGSIGFALGGGSVGLGASLSLEIVGSARGLVSCRVGLRLE